MSGPVQRHTTLSEMLRRAVQRLFPSRNSIPTPPDFFSGPHDALAYQNLPDSIEGVAIRRPRGTTPGSATYTPAIRPQPPRPPRKRMAEPADMGFFRHDALGPEIKPWAFPPAFDNPASPWLQTLKRLYADPITFPASISPEAGMLLHSIVRNMRPRIVIETGTYLGATAIWIAAALAETTGGVLHCFDDFIPVRPGPWRLAEMKSGVLEFVARHIREAGLASHVILHPGNSSYEIEASRDELAAAGGVQLAYLDADHRPRGVSQDLWAVEPVLPTGGLVILHDTFPSVCGDTGPRFILDNINDVATGLYQTLDLYLSPMNYGLGLLRRIG